MLLITGGAGFIGANLVHSLAQRGERVRILDDFSRPGAEQNLRWLTEQHGTVEPIVGDVRDRRAVEHAMRGVDHVYHLAAQVAVTTSLVDPRLDFDVNAIGTLQVLEAIRAQRKPPSLIYTSTHRVYGALTDVALDDHGGRWEPESHELRDRGISETQPLSFHSPYGCSKGAADQYVLDWAHTFGIRAVVFRMSCIYGPRQLGTADHGWVAHFLTRALRGEAITIYGDGKQVRDILFIDDLLDAFHRVRAEIDGLAGRVFNVGGGPESTMSLVELLERIEELGCRPVRIHHEPWRVADQRWYVSDTRHLAHVTGWAPQIVPEAGVARLFEWLKQQPTDRSPTHAPAEARP